MIRKRLAVFVLFVTPVVVSVAFHMKSAGPVTQAPVESAKPKPVVPCNCEPLPKAPADAPFLKPQLIRTRPATAERSARVNLQAAFKSYNQEYFGGRLLANTEVVWSHELDDAGDYGDSVKKSDGHFLIRVSPYWNPGNEEARLTLLHEMCHVDTWGANELEHGPSWRTCRDRIMIEGALDDLF